MTSPTDRPITMVVLAKGWTGYFDAAYRALAQRGVDMTILRPDTMANTAFDLDALTYARFLSIDLQNPKSSVRDLVGDLRPDVVLTQSWEVAPYRRYLRELPRDVFRVLWMDNIQRGTLKQAVGKVVSPWYLHRLFDVAMVPSDRSELFARDLGFAPSEVIRGATPADTTLFTSPPRTGAELASRRRFVAVLRLVHHKGADVLAEAYARYRKLTDNPWDLAIAGIGEMESHFDGIPGVEMLGFRQPEQLAQEMRESSCLINPSRLEPYAVVLQEAASSGLPILCTDFVGAAPMMIQDGYNGWVIEGGRADLLAEAMARMSSLPEERLGEMSAISQAMASRLSPSGWARNLREELDRRL